jgi:limonene-1,2-epoxide hydrolase
MSEGNIKTVEVYLNGLKNKDVSGVPFANDIFFQDPIAGMNRGADNFRAFLSGLLPAINDVRITRHIAEGDYVVTRFEVDGIFGVVPILEMFKVENGEITEAIGYFDPRPIIG